MLPPMLGSPCLRLFDIAYDVEYANPTAPNVYVPPREMHQLLTRAVGCDN